MNVVSDRSNARKFPIISIAALFVSVIVSGQAQSIQSTPSAQAPPAPLSYTVTDLGTLGGSTSIASTAGGQIGGLNLAGMIVGSSTTTDKSEHAFLSVDGQMYDLNLLCDLSTSNFKVLTAAKTINDCLDIVGEGVTVNGDKHAFLLTPTPVNGGRWCYSCCQWIWKQDGGGWQWESNCHCYQWHGGPGDHPACPSQPPPCFWWPLPCPEGCGCDHPPPPRGWCYCCINGHIYIMRTEKCQANGGQCFNTIEEAKEGCEPKWGWCCLNGNVVKMTNFECRKKGGQWFATEEDAIRDCKACWWCCVDGKVFQTTWVDCQTKGGQCYATQDEANAHQKDCTPKGWCCFDGKIFPSTPEECQKKGGQYFTSQKEAIEHQRDCKPCWCCFQGREGKQLVQTTKEDCQRRGGQCFDTPEEARKVGCIQKDCWVCINNKPVRISEAEAQAKGLKCYPTSQEAAAHCRLCWCCIDGKIVQLTEEECQKRGGKCYRTREEAIRNSKKDCKPMCWCCRPGRDTKEVVYTTEEDCRQHNGQCYGSEEDAKAHCNPPPPDCWCCVDMPGGLGVANTTPEDCKNRGTGVVGDHCYATKEDAIDHCRPCWCCVPGPNGTFTYIRTTEADCNARGGAQQCYQTKEDAIAACAPPPGPWCCAPTKDRNGQAIHHAFPSTAQQCAAEGGQLFNTQAEALANCNLCWCCPQPGNGQVFLLDAAYCKQLDPLAQCYPTRDDAMKGCAAKSPTPAVTTSPTPGPAVPARCWSCVDGKIVQTTDAESRQRGLPCYGSEQEARAHCGEKLCWACIDGQVVQIPEAKARARRAQCYRSEEEARAHCKAKTVWCCMDGQVVQVTEEECRARGGHAYRSEQEARKNCKGKACWVCLNGKVVQLPEAQARSRGVQCFSSREEAAANCRPKETCWCCINGRVVQATPEQCRARGGQCFGSKEEAARNCSGGAGPTKPPKRPGRRP